MRAWLPSVRRRDGRGHNDPVEGVTNVRGAVMLALWDAFKRKGVEIPFPVREVRFGDGTRIAVEPPASPAKRGVG